MKIKEYVRFFLEPYWHKLFISGSVFRLGVAQDMKEEEFGEIYKFCKSYTMTSVEKMYALYKVVKYIVEAKIPGDFVECGVWRGGSAMIMALTLLRTGDKDRKIYLYDTFAGMTKPTDKDRRALGSSPMKGVWEKMQKENHNEWALASLAEVKKNMKLTGYPEENIIFVEGRVEDTIPKILPSSVALLRLDTDWYESTLHELRHLFPLLVENGALIIDDYGCFEGAREAVDTYIRENNIPILLNRVDYSGRVGIKVNT